MLDPYDTGRACMCAGCQGSFTGWYVIEGKRGKETKRRHPEVQCSGCDCRLVSGVLHPCANFDDPRSGIRHIPAPPEAASVTRLDWYAMERLQKLFPGISLDQMFAVAVEIDLYLRLREIFPDASLSWLQSLRAGLVSATCHHCGQVLPWAPAFTAELERAPAHPPVLGRPKAYLLRRRGRRRPETAPEPLSLF